MPDELREVRRAAYASATGKPLESRDVPQGAPTGGGSRRRGGSDAILLAALGIGAGALFALGDPRRIERKHGESHGLVDRLGANRVLHDRQAE